MSIIKTPITIALTVLLLLGVTYLGWSYWSSEDEPIRALNPFEFHLVQNSCNHFAEELEGMEGLYDLVVLPIHEKRKRNIPEMLADYLSYNTRINVKSMEDIYETTREKKKELKKKEEKTAFDEEEYLNTLYTKKVGSGVLKILVEDFKSGKRGKGAGIHLKGELYLRTESGGVKKIEVPSFKQYIKTKFSFIYFSAWMKSHSPWWRGIFWFLFMIFLPLSTTSLIVKIAGWQSNKYNFLMIMVYTGVDVLLAFFLVGFILYNSWVGFLIFLAFLVSGIYNYEICDLVDDWN